jgi:glutamine synthetase
MAGLDGIQNKIDPGNPLDKDIYELPLQELAQIKSVPGSLAESLDALESDYEFLLKGGVFTEDLISTWLDYKRENEVIPVQLRPTPHEYSLYYDI